MRIKGHKIGSVVGVKLFARGRPRRGIIKRRIKCSWDTIYRVDFFNGTWNWVWGEKIL